MWERQFWEGVWPYLDPWDSVRLRTASTHWNVPGKYGPHGELFFFLIKKEQVVASSEVLPNPCVSAETLKACALNGLHLLATEGEDGSSGRQSPDSCPESPCDVTTLSHGQKAKALLLSSANTTWPLTVMGPRPVSGRDFSAWKTRNWRGWL